MSKIGVIMDKWKAIIWFLMIGLFIANASALPIKIGKTDINPDKTIVSSTIRMTAFIDTTDESPKVNANITFPSGENAVLDMVRDEAKDQLSAQGHNAYYLEFYKTIETGKYGVIFKAVSGKDVSTAENQFEIVKQDVEVDYVAEVEKVHFTEKITNQTKMAVGTTEYTIGDEVLVFVQLTEGEQPIDDATCKLNVWRPDFSMWADEQIMSYVDGSNGLYFYKRQTKNCTHSGIHMMTVDCAYGYDSEWYYPAGEVSNFPDMTVQEGTHEGGAEVVLNDYDDWLYQKFRSTTGGATKKVIVDYDFNLTGYDENATELQVFWMGESSDGQVPTLKMYVYNWSSSSYFELGSANKYYIILDVGIDTVYVTIKDKQPT